MVLTTVGDDGDGGTNGSRRAGLHPRMLSAPWLGRRVARRGPEPGSICLVSELFVNALIELIALPVAMTPEGCSSGRAGTKAPSGCWNVAAGVALSKELRWKNLCSADPKTCGAAGAPVAGDGSWHPHPSWQWLQATVASRAGTFAVSRACTGTHLMLLPLFP